MNRSLGLLILPFLISLQWAEAGGEIQNTAQTPNARQTRRLTRAHAHNDYNHERPLLDALSHGFCSIEADIFLVDGKLLVGHDRVDLETERTLEALYLDPLLKRVRENGGYVFEGGPVFTLLVDIKSDGEETYIALDRVLMKYKEMLTSVNQGKVEGKAVTVIISGNRAWERITADTTRYAGVDGRLSDLSSDRPNHVMPLVSDSWAENFSWRGQGPMPDAERARLERIVLQAHKKGRRVRFWATPDRPSPERTAVWTELLVAGVDLIGTDDLAGLEAFLLSRALFISSAQRDTSVIVGYDQKEDTPETAQ